MANKTWTVYLVEDLEDPSALVLPFPPDLLKEAGWEPGDTLIFDVQDDDTVIITRK